MGILLKNKVQDTTTLCHINSSDFCPDNFKIIKFASCINEYTAFLVHKPKYERAKSQKLQQERASYIKTETFWQRLSEKKEFESPTEGLIEYADQAPTS